MSQFKVGTPNLNKLLHAFERIALNPSHTMASRETKKLHGAAHGGIIYYVAVSAIFPHCKIRQFLPSRGPRPYLKNPAAWCWVRVLKVSVDINSMGPLMFSIEKLSKFPFLWQFYLSPALFFYKHYAYINVQRIRNKFNCYTFWFKIIVFFTK